MRLGSSRQPVGSLPPIISNINLPCLYFNGKRGRGLISGGGKCFARSDTKTRSVSWADDLVPFDRSATRQDGAIVSADILNCVELAVDVEDRSDASVQINGLVMSGLDAFNIRDENPVGHSRHCVMAGSDWLAGAREAFVVPIQRSDRYHFQRRINALHQAFYAGKRAGYRTRA